MHPTLEASPETGPAVSEQLLAGLTDAQRHAVVSEAAPLCVLAGAGAGKTRVLTRRIAHRVATGSVAPAHVLALTFTRKAAGELGARLHALGLREEVATGTFHALAAAQLRRWWADRNRRAPAVLDRPGRLLGPLVAARPAFAGVAVSEVVAHLQWARARDLGPSELAGAAAAAGRVLPVPAQDLVTLAERYQHEKLRRGLVDFDDLLSRCADAIESDPVFAAAQRWRWRHVFVDELQDLNPLQHRLLLAWLGPSVDLCAVGDPHQAIYGWNGADPGILAGLAERWPTTEVVHLDANHRCSPQVVAAGASVLGSSGARLRSSQADGPPVTVQAWPSDDTEAAGVAAAVRRAHSEGQRWSGMAVLVRTNAQAVRIAERCREAGVPVRVPGQTDPLDHPAVRAALVELRRRPAAPLSIAAADLAELARQADVAPDQAPDESAAALGALADLARQAARLEPGLQIGAWAATLAAELDGDAGGAADAVTVCSFHRAKGLEWEAVWVCGLEEGLVPIGRATSPAQLDEERRLLYVALTRAARRLTCSWARQRSFGGHAVPRDPSPWLEVVAAAAGGRPGDQPAEPTVEEWQRRFAARRDDLAGGPRGQADPARLPPGSPAPDGVVLEALRGWRAATARASAVPAHVVLHDATLVALASARPHDEAGLLRVPGLGPVKASRYGETLLSLVAEPA